jgi:hypothetical protein
MNHGVEVFEVGEECDVGGDGAFALGSFARLQFLPDAALIWIPAEEDRAAGE